MINDSNFKEKLKGIQMVEVSGESCANCLTLMPMLHEIAEERCDIELVHIEAQEDTTNFLKEYEIDRVPTILLLDDGKVFARAVGFQPKEIFELWLDAMLEDYKRTKA